MVDAASLPTAVEVTAGGLCAARRLSIPNRLPLACDGLASEPGGTRVTLRGHPSTRWTLSVERTDGSPGAVCAAVLDALCRCARAECTDAVTERMLIVDLGVVEDEEVEIMLPAGTYSVELCTR